MTGCVNGPSIDSNCTQHEFVDAEFTELKYFAVCKKGWVRKLTVPNTTLVQLAWALFGYNLLTTVTEIVDRFNSRFNHRFGDHETRIVYIRLSLIGEANSNQRLAIALHALQDDIAIRQF